MHLRASQINGCSFCLDMGARAAPAETETGGWRSEVVTALLASGMAEREMLQGEADLGSRMAPSARQGGRVYLHLGARRDDPPRR